MVYVFSQLELDQITAAFNQANLTSDETLGKYRETFDLIYEILTDEGTFDSPVVGLEENVWTWISGARQVNSGEGFSAYFIREYTRSQHEQRYGLGLTDSALNIASNTIARNFILDILQGVTPTIEEIGLIDAAPIAGQIFNLVEGSNFAAWSGAVLFPYLGIDTYFTDWLINDQSVNQFKPLEGTYDLFSSAAATIPLSNNTFEVMSNFLGTCGLPGTFNAIRKSFELSQKPINSSMISIR